MSNAGPNSKIVSMCFLASLYGVGFGLFMLPTALFVGPHGLIASVGHIFVGAVFGVAASRLSRGHSGARWLAAGSAFACLSIGVVAAVQSYAAEDTASVVFCIAFSAYFLFLISLSIRYHDA